MQPKPKNADMVTVGGIISLTAIIAAIIGIIVCQLGCVENQMRCSFCHLSYTIITVPFFILGLAISLITFIVRLVNRLIMHQKGIIRDAKGKNVGKGSFLSSVRVAFAIIFGIVGIYVLIMVISSPFDSAAMPILCSIILVILSILLFAIGFMKKKSK